jgi:putative serine protease PepD
VPHLLPKTISLKAGLALLILITTFDSVGMANEAIYQRAVRSTVWVVAVETDDQVSVGTGALVDLTRKLVATNYHVVGEKPKVFVFFPGYRDGELIAEVDHYLEKVTPLEGKVVSRDAKRDLALIQLPSVPEGVEEFALAPKSASPAQSLHSIGNSGVKGGALWRYTRHPSVRNVYLKKIKTEIGVVEARMVETDGAINKGDSGGPLINERGQLVGIVQSFDSDNRLVSNAIDVNELKDLLNRVGETPAETPAAVTPNPAAKSAPPAAPSVLGTWSIRFTDDKGNVVGVGFTFKADGVFDSAVSTGQDMKQSNGRYTFTADTLSLVFVTGERLQGKVTWVDQNRFVMQVAEGTQLTFNRFLG